METRHKHKIDKIHLRINTPSEEDGHYLKDNAGKWVNEKVLSCLEDYIAGIESEIGENIIQFNQLKISLEMKDGKLNDGSVCQQIKDQLDAQIRAFLNKIKAGKTSQAGSKTGKDHQDNNSAQENGSFATIAAADRQQNQLSGSPDRPDANAAEGNIIDAETRTQDAVLYFLKTGRCAWWISAQDMNALLEENALVSLFGVGSPGFYRSLVYLLSAPAARTRMIRQFSGKLLQRILTHAFYSARERSFPSDFQEKLPDFIHQLTTSEKEKFWSAVILLLQVAVSGQEVQHAAPELWTGILQPVFASSAHGFPSGKERRELSSWLEKLTQQQPPEPVLIVLSETVDEETIRRAMETGLISAEKAVLLAKENAIPVESLLISAENKPVPLEKPGSSESQATQEEVLKQGMIVENAGLILLNPYFKSFLLQTALISEKNEFTDPGLAVHVMHYLATGRQHDWDYNLLFEKFLCNVPLHESIDREREIPAGIKEEADALLEAVVENWTVLGKSSIDLLRNEFLQRQGKLFMDEMSVRLVVERKTQDILIDRIPWGFSTAKLPWQKDLIYTTW